MFAPAWASPIPEPVPDWDSVLWYPKYTVPVFLLVLLPLCVSVGAEEIRNGFILDDVAIPVPEIVAGGPPRDGIPAIDDPRFVAATDAGFLADRDRVIGIAIDGEARAYPIKILDWHEVVNDKLGEQYLAVTWSPLCGSGIVFATNAEDDRLVFGVSGLLYNNNILLYDKNTESLWLQLDGVSVSGTLKDVHLPRLVSRQTTWARWRESHPDTLVMSIDTGYRRNYDQSPYPDYEQRTDLYFEPTGTVADDYHPKQAVLAVELGGISKAYPFVELERRNESVFDDVIGFRKIQVHWDSEARSAFVTGPTGEELPTVLLYWFAWSAFNPRGAVYIHDTE